MLTIQIPNTYEPERRYILSVMFTEFLGLDIQIHVADSKGVLITNNDHYQFFLADGLFNTPQDQWMHSTSLPQQPLRVWKLATIPLKITTIESQLPVIYGDDPNTLKSDNLASKLYVARIIEK